MGLFDRIILTGMKCPKCGREFDDFQTKSGPRLLRVYVTGKRYAELSRYRYIDVYDFCEHEGGTTEIMIRIPILVRGRVSSDKRKYKVRYKDYQY